MVRLERRAAARDSSSGSILELERSRSGSDPRTNEAFGDLGERVDARVPLGDREGLGDLDGDMERLLFITGDVGTL